MFIRSQRGRPRLPELGKRASRPWLRAAAALLLVLTAGLAAAQDNDEPPAISPLREAYLRQRDAIPADEAEARYRLGMQFYLQWDGKTANLEPLELAVAEFRAASNVFEVTLKDGQTVRYYVEEPDPTDWQRIIADYREQLEDVYKQIHARDKDAATRAIPVEQFTAANRREVLLKAADNYAKLTPPQQQALAPGDIPVSLAHPEAVRLHRLVSAELRKIRGEMSPDYWAMAFLVIGGLGIFLMGMKNMSEGVQAVAGSRLRRMINAVTDNRFSAVAIGTGVTCLVQSSTITTVIVVGLVNAGLMLVHQAIGVIMGANIGTTITGWVLALQIGKYGLPILGVSVFVYIFSKRDRWRYLAMIGMGLGMIFFGLEMMKDGFAPMKGVPAFENAFRWFQADTYFGVLKCALVGCLLTFLVQSSSATLGITIGLAAIGAIPFETAGALVLGENVGTTITAWLASLGATTNAKRAAYAHVGFNLIGVFWITLIYSWGYMDAVGWLVERAHGVNPVGLDYKTFTNKGEYASVVTIGIATVHTVFNLLNTAMFLPFVRAYARLLERIIPDKPVKEPPHLTTLDMRLIESPIIAIENSRKEIVKMGGDIDKMLDWTRQIVQQDIPDDTLVRKVFHREEITDVVQKEVIAFVTDVLTGDVPHATAVEGRQQLRLADEFESMADYIASIVKGRLRLHREELGMTPAERDGLLELHDLVAQYVKMIAAAFEHQQADILTRARSSGKHVTAKAKELREDHLQRQTDEQVHPLLSMSYVNIINAYRKIRGHALNIAEAMADGD